MDSIHFRSLLKHVFEFIIRSILKYAYGKKCFHLLCIGRLTIDLGVDPNRMWTDRQRTFAAFLKYKGDEATCFSKVQIVKIF